MVTLAVSALGSLISVTVISQVLTQLILSLIVAPLFFIYIYKLYRDLV
jgi:hypothetical protein